MRCRSKPSLLTVHSWRPPSHFVESERHFLAEVDIFISYQNPQPRRLQNPCECPESREDGVAHEDAGLCLDAVEGGDRGHLRLQASPQGVRAPQLFDSLQGEEKSVRHFLRVYKLKFCLSVCLSFVRRHFNISVLWPSNHPRIMSDPAYCILLEKGWHHR